MTQPVGMICRYQFMHIMTYLTIGVGGWQKYCQGEPTARVFLFQVSTLKIALPSHQIGALQHGTSAVDFLVKLGTSDTGAGSTCPCKTVAGTFVAPEI